MLLFFYGTVLNSRSSYSNELYRNHIELYGDLQTEPHTGIRSPDLKLAPTELQVQL